MTTPLYDAAFAERALQGRIDTRGGSSYFTPTRSDLDPALFAVGTYQPDRLRPDVRHETLTRLYRFWAQKHYRDPLSWSRVWFAGSGVTGLWASSREAPGVPGDLDTLIGVDFPAFFRDNPQFAGTPDEDMAEHFNDEFRDGLDKDTAHIVYGGKVFEQTWYVNPGGADIRAINAYAAYDVSGDRWTIRPGTLGRRYEEFPAQWRQQVERERGEARKIINEWVGLRRLYRLNQGNPIATTLLSSLHDVTRRAANLFDSIHLDRKKAFNPGGQGYDDYFNFRWQAHKLFGTGPALHTLKSVDVEAHRDASARCYGGPILDTGHALMFATLANGVQ